jgi:hypothetical protein
MIIFFCLTKSAGERERVIEKESERGGEREREPSTLLETTIP